jgi:hypothetical protein
LSVRPALLSGELRQSRELNRWAFLIAPNRT